MMPRVIIPVVALVLLGALIIVCGLVVVPYVVKMQLDTSTKLVSGSESYDTWLNPAAPVYMNFYFFNVTNVKQLKLNWTRPHVRQIGPYVYREIRNKTDVELINAGATLRYRQHKWFVFDANRSCGLETDVFTTINIPLLTIASYVRFSAKEVQTAAHLALVFSGLQLFEKHTVSELLWGYQPKFPSVIQYLLEELHMLPTWGIYVGATANGTDDGEYEIETGQNDISQLGHITSWKQSRSVQFWTDPNCNMINGTDGSFWHPLVSKSDTLYAFNTDLCRSLYFTCDGTESVVSGVSTYHFVPPPRVFDSPEKNPDNRGFCTPATDCLLDGVLNVTECRGAPIILSSPHFYQADTSYQEAIDGLSPNASCQTYLDVEPNTGYLLKAEKKMQVNVYLRRTEIIRDTRQLKQDLIFPIMWANENVVIGEDTGKKLKTEVIDKIHVAEIVKYCMLAVGAVVVLTGCLLLAVFIFRRRFRSDSVHVQVKNRMAAADDDGDDEDAQLIDAGST